MSMFSTRKTNRRQPITLDAQPVTEEALSAADFLKLAQENPGLIKSSRVVMPQAGAPGFGSFLVRYTSPRHKTA